MPSVTLINYGMGNIPAFINIYHRLNITVEVASCPAQLLRSKKIIMPGVGSFDWAMTRLNDSGLREALDEMVMKQQIPVLGICVGMQMMAKGSEEGCLQGLGWIEAKVKRFDQAAFTSQTHLPHMGWNDVMPVRDNPLFASITAPMFYFLHSYYFVPGHASQTLATTQYGDEFTSAMSNGNVYGVQFHPEKSHNWGIQLLKNFAEM
ncbi:glutamine amidotransferase [Desulfocicer vacuolatum DSM 3385]|uniref:Imidazole glycerol phosphate synthase subunit HisH n=1 Tax=Desulfocicer vacuolatum DSM 3385 TaxID=1121400 RepID=A0A1W1Z4Z4_9BACT|nr:imidazole glycerol phosphate synthase subunit HisH [Desulfocicer vacuolatum]SMC43382.1 glutamine amidotransferase [Desulfocicer vacuolatum DSM 3385]